MKKRNEFDLVFTLGRTPKGDEQWQSVVTDGVTKVVHVPDIGSKLKPSDKQVHFNCTVGRVIASHGRIRVVTVFLTSIIRKPFEEMNEGELEAELVDGGIDLDFVRGKNPNGDEQWECRVKETMRTTLYVVDRSSLLTPALSGERYGCVEVRELFNGPNFRIMSVNLLIQREAVVMMAAPQLSKAKRGGRSAEKREQDRRLRNSMKNGGKGNGGGKKQKQMSA